jgi:hypothetical protein
MSTLREEARRLRSAGGALRERREEELVERLGHLLEQWRDPRGPWQAGLARALAASAGFSEATVREGLRLALADWNEAALRRVLTRELAGRPTERRTGFALTSVLCGGAIPMPTLLQILLSLLVRSPVLVKPASHDPVTARWVQRSLAEIDPALGECVAVVDVDHGDEEQLRALLASDCVVCSGGDATIASVARRIRPEQRFVAYGHRFSIAAVAADRLDHADADRVALDVSLWDQLGCMSPVEVYLVGAQSATAGAFAESLASALARREEQAPLGEVDLASASLIRHERDAARMRAAAGGPGSLHESAGLRWTVVEEPDDSPRPAPLHRFVRVRTAPTPDALQRTLAPRAHQLSTVGVSGDLAIPALGESRQCALGRMQTPPLDAPHDGQPLLLPILP